MENNELSDLLGSDPQPSDDGIAATLSESELAALLGIGTSRIRTLCRDGVIRRASRGKFNARDALAAYVANLREQASRAGRSGIGQSDDLKAEKTRLAKEQADKLALANAAARKELVPASEVTRQWGSILRDLRAQLLAVSSRVGAKLPHLSAHDVAEIEREIKAALEAIADGN